MSRSSWTATAAGRGAGPCRARPGHRAGVKPVRATVQSCARERRRDADAVRIFQRELAPARSTRFAALMSLFVEALEREDRGARSRTTSACSFIGDRECARVPRLRARRPKRARRARAANSRPAPRRRRRLRRSLGPRPGRAPLAEDAGGRQARSGRDRRGDARVARCSRGAAGRPISSIRTGGEKRVSNFLLWNLAYAELYFSALLWPDFDAAEFDGALDFYAGRERRFGRTGEQIEAVG